MKPYFVLVAVQIFSKPQQDSERNTKDSSLIHFNALEKLFSPHKRSREQNNVKVIFLSFLVSNFSQDFLIIKVHHQLSGGLNQIKLCDANPV